MAFIAGVIATIVRARLRHRVQLLEALPDEQRLEYLVASLETYRLRHDNLTTEQKRDLMLAVLDGRSARLRILTRTMIILAIIFAFVVVLSVSYTSDSPQRQIELNQWLDEAWDALAGFSDASAITDFSEPNTERARRALRNARAIDPHHPDVYLVEATLHFIGGSAVEAELSLREGLRRAPQDFDLQYNLGVMLARQQQWQEASAAFYKAVQLVPESPHPHFGLANLHKAQGNLEEAARAFTEVLNLAPNDAQAHFELARIMHDVGDHDSAMRHYASAVGFAPENALFRFQLANAYLAENKMGLARSHFEEAIRLDPTGYPNAYVNLGMILFFHEKWDHAESALQRAIVLDPTSAKAHTNLGNILYAKGEFEQAADAHRTAVSIDATAHRYLNLANALVRTGDVDQAIAEYQHATSLNPGLSTAIRDHGRRLVEQGEIPSAIVVLEEACRIRQDDPYARNYYGVALARGGQLDAAIREFREALRLKSDFAEAQRNLEIALRDR